MIVIEKKGDQLEALVWSEAPTIYIGSTQSGVPDEPTSRSVKPGYTGSAPRTAAWQVRFRAGVEPGALAVPVNDRGTFGGLTQFATQFWFWAEPLARKPLILKMRRDVRVVEGARLESVCRGNSTVGSNPTLSANLESITYRK